MAFTFGNIAPTVAVVVRKDDKIATDLTDAEWNSYVTTLDESHLRLTGIPTRFVLKTELNFADQQAIQSMQMGVSEDGKPEIRLGFILEVVRRALTGIENPSDLPTEQHIVFRKERDGAASKELIARLNGYGVAMDLYTAREAALTVSSATPTKK